MWIVNSATNNICNSVIKSTVTVRNVDVLSKKINVESILTEYDLPNLK